MNSRRDGIETNAQRQGQGACPLSFCESRSQSAIQLRIGLSGNFGLLHAILLMSRAYTRKGSIFLKFYLLVSIVSKSGTNSAEKHAELLVYQKALSGSCSEVHPNSSGLSVDDETNPGKLESAPCEPRLLAWSLLRPMFRPKIKIHKSRGISRPN